MTSSVVIYDPMIVEFKRDYDHVMKDGNPLGMTLIEYIVARWLALGSQTYAASSTSSPVFYPRWSPMGLQIGTD